MFEPGAKHLEKLGAWEAMEGVMTLADSPTRRMTCGVATSKKKDLVLGC